MRSNIIELDVGACVKSSVVYISCINVHGAHVKQGVTRSIWSAHGFDGYGTGPQFFLWVILDPLRTKCTRTLVLLRKIQYLDCKSLRGKPGLAQVFTGPENFDLGHSGPIYGSLLNYC